MRVLYVEDSASDAGLARAELRRSGAASVEVAATLADARRLLAERAFDALLLDLRLPDGSGLELLQEVRERGLPLAVVILTSTGDEQTAVAALKAGADDYLPKRTGFAERLAECLERARSRFQAETARRGRVLRVLYAEPHAADVTLLQRHLKAHAPHIRVEVAAGGEEALQRLAAAAFDAVLLDYRLPGMSALDVLKVVREERRLDLPVVIVTGQGDEDVAAQALRLGATEYLVKTAGYLHALPSALENAHHRVLLGREQEALRASQARLAAVVESAFDGIVAVDERHRVLIFNPAAEAMFGVRAQEAVGSPLGRFLPGMEDAVLESAAGLLLSVRGRRATGEEFPAEASLAGSRGDAHPSLTIVLRDVTERARAEAEKSALEAQLRQSQKLEAVGRLAGGVAHDFNNMLNVILGYAGMVVQKLGPDDPLQAPLRGLCEAAHRSAGLTRQLLAFSRRQVVAPRVLDLNTHVRGLDWLLRRILGDDVELRLDLCPAPWPVRIDPSQVEQALANLAVNARDALPRGGRVSVETANVTADAVLAHGAPGDYVKLALSDDGVGMDAPTRERAFEPFFTTKPEGKGTGLGLATIYGAMRQNEGFVDLVSELGRGTTVSLYLPRYTGPERPD